MQLIANALTLSFLLVFLVAFAKQPEAPVSQISVVQDAPVSTRNIVKLSKQDLKCLADNIYHEARGEGLIGMEAVAHVTLNRVMAPGFPSSVCEVVYQPYQFSWTEMKGQLGIYEKNVYAQAKAIAVFVAETGEDITKGSLFFHSVNVKPSWRNSMEYALTVNNHVFYRGRSNEGNGIKRNSTTSKGEN